MNVDVDVRAPADSRSPAPDPRPTLKKPDYFLAGATVALLIVGAVMVYSASFIVAHNEYGDDFYFLSRHLKSLAVGVVALGVALRVDYHRLRVLSFGSILVCVGLLLLVLVPGVGSSSYGAVRWINIGGGFQLQPSELAKLAMLLYLADWLSRRERHLVRGFGTGSLPFAVIVLTVAALVELQPDLGTTAIIVGSAACVFFVAGANLLHIGMLSSVGLLGVVALISRLSGYRQGRISAFLDPWSDIQGSGWHTAQGLIALGSGGILGTGLGGSLQKFYWVPNAHTDAIFAIIGEELGFVGCVGVLALFGVLAWRGFAIAWTAPDIFGRLLATGLTCMLILQALVNIAVVTNSLPYTGITLPLVSYGGTSTVISLAAVGLLLNVSRYRGLHLPDTVYEPHTVAGAPAAVRQHGGNRRGRKSDPDLLLPDSYSPGARARRGARSITLGGATLTWQSRNAGGQVRPLRPRAADRLSDRRRHRRQFRVNDG